MSDAAVKAPVDGEWLVPAPWAKWAPRIRANVVVILRGRMDELTRVVDGENDAHRLQGMHGIREEIIATRHALYQLEQAICPEGEIDE